MKYRFMHEEAMDQMIMAEDYNGAHNLLLDKVLIPQFKLDA